MAKRKNGTTETVQHTSTSEAVKTRPRKRTNNGPLQSAGIVPRKTPNLEEKENMVNSFQPMALVHLDELAEIWDNDKRVPTVDSRRAWAMARNIKPDHVHRWWARRKQIAKKARQAVPKGTYDLPVGTPPVIKDETPAPPEPEPPVLEDPPPSLIKTEDEDSIPDAPSSDTLVSSSPVCRGPKKFDAPFTSPIATPRSPLPPSSPPVTSSPTPAQNSSSPSLHLPSAIRTTTVTPVQRGAWCTQGRADTLESPPSTSRFTCALCITDPNVSEIIADDRSSPLFAYEYGHEHVLSDDYMRMELSALPFLLRSPDLLQTGLPPPITRWCLNSRSYALDGSFVGPCVCAFRPTSCYGFSCGGTALCV